MDGEAPESAGTQNTHYLMTSYHALLVARKAEERARDFYAAVSRSSSNPEVKKMAAEFADEEAQHVSLILDWIDKHPEPEEGWDYDPDPPTMPE